jgi:hypothetical protein
MKLPRIASSTGLLLKMTGLKVTAIKIDPYMNVDAGTMRPTEHGKRCPRVALGCALNLTFVGEVYVLNDGGEVDLDLGNYERYLDVTLSRDNNITTGKIYQHVIEREVLLFPLTASMPFSLRIKRCTATRRLSGTNSAGESVCLSGIESPSVLIKPSSVRSSPTLRTPFKNG